MLRLVLSARFCAPNEIYIRDVNMCVRIYLTSEVLQCQRSQREGLNCYVRLRID
jgi:hypothetical protein